MRLGFVQLKFSVWTSFSVLLVLFDCRADDRLDLPEKEAQVQRYAKVFQCLQE
jgi:hypothetical protein